MSAWFRRRGATCDAIQYDGTNDEECAKLADCPVESIAKGVRVGQWLVMGHDAFLYQLDDDRFRERYEPVPLPEPAPADGWQPIETAPFDGSTVLTINERDLYPVAAFFCEVWLRETDGPEDVVIAGRHEPLYRPPTHWRPLPSPPVVEGGK